MMGKLRLSAAIVAPLLLILATRRADAQQAAEPGGGAGGAGSGGATGSLPAGGAQDPSSPPSSPAGAAPPAGPAASPAVPIFPGAVAPPAPGVPLGGGNATESSSQTYQGNHEDNFDYARGGNGQAATQYGGQDGPIYLGQSGGGGDGGQGGQGGRVSGGNIPPVYSVKKGDTLWHVCDEFFHNPYQWPRIWSYNPQLQNPHWIYPGDQVRLISGTGMPAANAPSATTLPAQNGGNLIDQRRQVPNDTVFLRDQGYIEDDAKENWGEISGAPEDKMFLSDFDEVYLRIAGNHDLKLGQELTIFRPSKSAGKGKIVQIEGTVRIDEWNPKDHIARGQVVESLDVIERGARVGPVGRRFQIVPPQRNDVDLKAQVVGSVTPHVFFGQNQVVFLDKGDKDGLKLGNRLFIIRRGDAWRQSLAAESFAQRIAIESQSPAAIERMPRSRDEARFPEEVIAELRIISLRPNSATALVSQATREIDLGDIAVARKGY